VNIIVHFPKSSEESEKLKKTVSKVHSEAVTAFINSLSCPKFQKLTLVDEIPKKGFFRMP